MRISVVIPTFNNAQYLPLAVSSVRAQTHAVHEIIVVDDGSTDDTPDVVKALGPEIRYVRQPNQGPSAARNHGAGIAQGEVIAFLDADDEWLPTAMSGLTGPLRTYPDAGLVTADMRAVDADGKVLFPSWFEHHRVLPRLRPWAGRPLPDAIAELIRTNFVHTSLVLVQRELFRELGGFCPDFRFAEDLELWTRIAARASVICLTDVLGLRRIHGANSTRNVEPQLNDWIRVAERIASWASPQLAAQGIRGQRLVADARTALGYWLFTQGRHADARRALAHSLACQLTARAAKYWAATFLPRSAAQALRNAKQRISP